MLSIYPAMSLCELFDGFLDGQPQVGRYEVVEGTTVMIDLDQGEVPFRYYRLHLLEDWDNALQGAYVYGSGGAYCDDGQIRRGSVMSTSVNFEVGEELILLLYPRHPEMTAFEEHSITYPPAILRVVDGVVHNSMLSHEPVGVDEVWDILAAARAEAESGQCEAE